MNMRLVDDYGDAGFGGYYAIEVSDDDEWYGDEYLGERPCPEATAALAFMQHRTEPSGVLTWSSKKAASRALAAARRAGKREVTP